MSKSPDREGSLDAPTRHPLDWKNGSFYNVDDLNHELERVFDICHGCRRCVNLCDAFPTLFDLVDESDTMEVDGVDPMDFIKVVDQCYLCDMCYMTKCPYVPPHEWNVDFPHLMLRAKAVKFKVQGAIFRDRVLTSTDQVGRWATIPLIDVTINALNEQRWARNLMEKSIGIHHQAVLPKFDSKTLRKRVTAQLTELRAVTVTATDKTRGKIALFATCYGNNNSPQLGEHLVDVFHHNSIQVKLVGKERCCGMPKMELGDLASVKRAKEDNIPVLADLVDQGYDLTALVPSCVLMFKQELPLMFPDDPDVKKVQRAFFDPFEYLWLRHKAGLLRKDFSNPLGDISYQVACHLRVQNIGYKARDVLHLIPDTRVNVLERCSGHDGTYAVKVETHDNAVKIGRPVARKVKAAEDATLSSDCPMAGSHIARLSETVEGSQHPISLLHKAYGL